MPKSPNDPAECSAEKEDMVTSTFDQVIGMGSKCVGCSGVWVWADKVSRPDYSSSHSFLKEFIWNLNGIQLGFNLNSIRIHLEFNWNSIGI